MKLRALIGVTLPSSFAARVVISRRFAGSSITGLLSRRSNSVRAVSSSSFWSLKRAAVFAAALENASTRSFAAAAFRSVSSVM